MSTPLIKLLPLVVALSLSLSFSISRAQQKPPTDKPAEDVVRVSTDLVQTAVMVFDKQSRFVENLKPEQFQLSVDGKPVPFEFFDRVAAGTAKEQKQIEAVAGAKRIEKVTAPTASYRGRTIIFFIDDLHLALDSLGRTRSALNRFLEQEMTPLDQVAFTSASGQIGFLQQLTDNKSVLRTALARVKPLPYVVLDTEQPRMSEFVAIRILNGDQDARNFYAEEMLRRGHRQVKGINVNALYEAVKNRARQIVTSFEAVTVNSLTSLENLVRTTGNLPGRKLVFFISDGFYIETKNSAGPGNDRLRRVIDSATRTGSVIYTIDARGLFAPFADASGEKPFDPSGRLDRASVGEGTLSQDGLNALAGDTGGRFLKNQNYFDSWVARMLDETSNYYLLAWRPVEEQKGGNFKRIEVTINGRPDLTVRLPRGFLAGQAKTAANAEGELATSEISAATHISSKSPEAALISALGAPSARKGLPTTLAVSFVDVPNIGPVLTASTQMASNVLGYGTDHMQPAAIDIAGVVLNDQGKPAGSFKTRLNVNPSAQSEAAAERAGVIYSHKLPLKPGIYQVRVAARDDRSGRVGSAAQWIEIPDLAGKKLTMSSLLVGGQLIGSGQNQATSEQVQFSVDRRFARGAHLNFLTIVYNALSGSGGLPELQAQIKISRAGQAIVTSPLRKVVVQAGADAARIPYGADIALQTLPAGRYLLQVTITDKVAKTSASQQVSFEIE
ncbi:MAG TPA: VWA domain-containing protein [Pyrinomonadaceae bacterium]|nr:VWA domain-containing protein [Pyrinomonadaceae bacterium]